MKRILAGLLAVSLLVMLVPAVAQAKGNPAGPQQVEERNQACGQAQAGASDAAALLQDACQRLQELQRVRNQTQAAWQRVWQALRDDLARLRKQYRLEIREETRAQIMAFFKQVVRVLEEEGKLSELEEALRELIAMAPAEPDSYRELGKIYRQRGERGPKVFCDGNELKPDVPPVIKEGRTLIPVRAIAEALGATVQWDEKERAVIITKGDITIQIQVDSRVMVVNGKRMELDVPAKNISNRVFVPLRFISQALQAKVDYYPEGQIVVVNRVDAQAQS